MLKIGMPVVLRNFRRGRNRWSGALAILALAVFLGGSMVALGQAQNTGTISGNVKDTQDKVVVGAAITLLNTATEAKRVEVSNAQGEYLFSDVAVGDYVLTVTAAGFGTHEVDSLHVDSDANVRTDVELRPASVAQEVSVESQGTTLDTRSATLGSLIDRKEVEDLPVDGNNVVSLAALLPGVSNVNAPTTFTSDTGGPTFNISGSRNNQNLFLLDGQLWNNLFYNTGLNFPPGQELQEISILLNNYKAQYGRNVGSIMNVLTRSGSNTVHGSLWEYAQNQAFNASDYISHENPHLVQNQFGATVGGPIKRDKIFYFLGVQDLRAAQAVFSSPSLFTPQERGWDVAPTATSPGTPHMCQYVGFAGMQCANFSVDFPTTLPTSPIAGVPYYNQYLRNPLENSTYAGGFISQVNAAWQQAGNTGNSPCYTALNALYTGPGSLSGQFSSKYLPYEELPSICFNPVSVAFLNKYMPFPNAIGTGGIAVANLTANQPRNDWDGLARVDFIHGRHTVDARFYITNANDVTSNSATNSGSAPGVANYEQDYNTGGIFYGNIGDTLVLTPNLLNVFRAGYKRYNYQINPSDHTTLQSLGSAIFQPAVVPALPTIEVENRFKVGSPNSTWSFTVNEDEEVDDNLSWTHGNHSFQWGAQYLHLQYLHRFDSSPSLESGLSYTEADASDFMAGLLVKATVGNLTNLGALQNDVYLYAQDDWRVSPRMTLNYGVRYELPFAWHSADDQGVTFAPGFQSRVIPSAPLDLGYEGDPFPGNARVRSRFNNVAPRFGFSYDLTGTGRTLVRGGMGIFYDALNAAVIGVGSPFHYSAVYNDPQGGMSQPLLGEPTIAPNYVKGSTFFGTPLSVNFVDPNVATPYTIATNLGFQQRVRSTGLLEVNYVGKLGRHQLIQFDLNPAIFDCTGAYYASNPNPITGYCPGGPGNLSSTDASQSDQARVTYPGFAYGGQGAVDNASIGTSSYNGLQVMYTQHASRSLLLKSSYTYAKSLDLQSNGQTSTSAVPQPSNLRTQYAVSDFDATQILNIGWVLDLPKVTRLAAPLRAILNNWIYSGVYDARTGLPVNVTIAGDQAFTGEPDQRPQATPGVSEYLSKNRHRSCPINTLNPLANCKVEAWFNNVTVAAVTTNNDGSDTQCVAPAAFCTPGFGQLGNVGRNSLRGPAFIATNMAVGRIFPMGREGRTLEFKADAFNVFNTPNLANPTAVLSNSTSNSTINTFGVVLATVGTNGNVGTNGRRMQLSLVLRY